MSYRYYLYGLHIESDLLCPELIPRPAAAPTDCQWQLAPLDAHLESASFSNHRFQIAPGVYQFVIRGVARYRIEFGKRVLIDPEPGTDEGDVRLYLLDSVVTRC